MIEEMEMKISLGEKITALVLIMLMGFTALQLGRAWLETTNIENEEIKTRGKL